MSTRASYAPWTRWSPRPSNYSPRAPSRTVTVEEIGRRAGVAVGSIYNNFGSKEGAHGTVVARALDADRAYMDRAYTPERSPVEQLAAASEQYLRFASDHPRFFRLLAFPAKPGPCAGAADTAALLSRRVDAQNARLAEGIERRGQPAGSRPAADRDHPVGRVERHHQPRLAPRRPPTGTEGVG